MKRQLLLTMTLLTLGLTATKAQNPQMGDYGYLYCHMHGNGRAWTAYALSCDGLQYHDLLRGDSVFSDAVHARIEGAPCEFKDREIIPCSMEEKTAKSQKNKLR